MLLHIDGEVVEIRPGEFFQSNKAVDSKYLEKIATSKKKGRPPKKQEVIQIFKEEMNGSST